MNEDILIVFIKIIVAVGWLLTYTILLTWAERKESAVIQDRIGANRASIFGIRAFGLFQPIADAIKMLFKEDFIPPFANKILHAIAPFVAFFFATISIIAIPFASDLHIGNTMIKFQAIDIPIALIFILSMMSIGIWGVIIAGWNSNNKYTVIGGMRATAQLISYEVAFGLSLIGVILVFPSLNLREIIESQNKLLLGFIPQWGFLLQPLGFLIFLIAAMAETKRIPFDLPEGESEIIGFFTEYSGMRFGLFMMTDFVEVLMVSVLLTTLFCGGYNFPYLYDAGFIFPWGSQVLLPNWAVVLIQFITFNIKVIFWCWFLLLVRWTFPRYRYDQLMDLGWKLLIPLAVLNIILTAIIIGLWIG